MEMSGKEYSMEELMKVVEKERGIMEDSGGGVTLCGGEPLMHPSYAFEILDELGRRGFHRTVDTTLYCSEQVLRDAFQRCELFLVDLKVMDSSKHKFYTGVPNEPILRNIKLLAELGGDFFIRIPLIVGVNADDENIEASASFLASIPWKRKTVNLLPYHDIGKGKHERMWDKYNPDGLSMGVPSTEQLEHAKEIFARHGLNATTGG